MKIFQAKPASQGIAHAKAYFLEKENLTVNKKTVQNTEAEIQKLNKAFDFLTSKIEKTLQTNTQVKSAAYEILQAHLELANDETIKEEIIEQIKEHHICAEFAVQEIYKKYIAMFEAMEDAYMRERAHDVKDISYQLTALLLNKTLKSLSEIDEEVILVTNELAPSQLTEINKKFVKGFITEIGGETAHVIIMAKNLSIPAVIGFENALSKLKNEEELIINGKTGQVWSQPDEATKNEIASKIENAKKKKVLLEKYINQRSITKDNVHFEIEANIGNTHDALLACENNADGVGLFRSEFLYMESTNWPTEESQYEAYKTVLEKMNNKPVIIRTLDIGGDKKLSYFEFPHEENPFLGYRAIRLCLDKPEIFRTQIRALLRASAFGNLMIMLPMISTIEEIKQAKQLIHKWEKELIEEKIKVGKYKIGIMIEIPSAAVCADLFIQEVDFFSIGTNDLIQYSMACDRQSDKVAYLYQPFSPSVLRLIAFSIEATKKYKDKFCGMCGSMAGDVLATPLLIGMGLDAFSVAISSILEIRYVMSQLDSKECQKLWKAASLLNNAEDIKELVKNFYEKHHIDY